MRGTKKLKLTTRGRYAVMAMTELARRGNKDPVPLTEIAQSGNISLSYLEQLFAGLRKNGLVKSYRGPGGGYILARAAAEIKIAEILESAEDCTPAKRNSKEYGAEQTGGKEIRALWDHIGEILYTNLQTISLHDVATGSLAGQ